MSVTVEVADDWERELCEDVIAVARDMKRTGIGHFNMRPGWTASVFAIHRKLRREPHLLRDGDTYGFNQRATVNNSR